VIKVCAAVPLECSWFPGGYPLGGRVPKTGVIRHLGRLRWKSTAVLYLQSRVKVFVSTAGWRRRSLLER